MTLETIKEMIEAQKELNKQIHPEWEKQNFNWDRAIWLECAEALESTGWAWWAKCNNMKILLNEKLYYNNGELFWKDSGIKLKTYYNKNTGYLLVKTKLKELGINKSAIGLHRLIYMFHNGNIPDGYDVDHIDQNKLNNKIENLRLVTKRENQLNSKKITNAKGYYFNKTSNKYVAKIRIGNNKRLYLGSFDTEKEAKAAYNAAKDTYHVISNNDSNKNCIDYNNLLVELVDIFHFLLSKAILVYKDEVDSELYQILNGQSIRYADMENIRKTIEAIAFCSLHKHSNDILLMEEQLRMFVVAFDSLSQGNKELHKEYFTKVALNKFRQDNGYKEGKYKKIWNGKEDNVYAYEIAYKMDNPTINKIYNELEKVYRGIK